MKIVSCTFFASIGLIVSLASSQMASAEVFKNIFPSTQPGDLSRLFPSSKTESISIQNQLPNTLTIALTDGSLTGMLVVGFTDWLKLYERAAQNNPADESTQSILADYRSGKHKQYKVDFVRWIPKIEQISISTLYKLYGKPTTKEIDKDTFLEIQSWGKNGVAAGVQNGQATWIEYYFTPSDEACEPYVTKGFTCPAKVKRKADKNDLMWKKAKRDYEKKYANEIAVPK